MMWNIVVKTRYIEWVPRVCIWHDTCKHVSTDMTSIEAVRTIYLIVNGYMHSVCIEDGKDMLTILLCNTIQLLNFAMEHHLDIMGRKVDIDNMSGILRDMLDKIDVTIDTENDIRYAEYGFKYK